MLQPLYRVCYTGTMKTARHNLYIPLELYEKLKLLAEKDLRSLNKECIHFLTMQVEQRRDDLLDFKQENNDGKQT